MRHGLMLSSIFLAIAGAIPAAAAAKLTVLQDLTQQTGGGPENPPIIGQNNVLYGSTYTSKNGGGIYSIGRNGKNFALLYEFPGGVAGSGPFGGVIQGSDGLLYGTTLDGGTSGQGTVFQFDPVARTATILHAFDIADGATPYAGVVQDGSGNFYGTTSAGGKNNLGTIYKIAAGTFEFSKLADVDSASGGTPYAPLLIGRDGLLYGTTTGIATSGNGAIFRVSPQGGKVEVLHNFSGKDGSGPFAGLAGGRGEVFYGTTDFGGAGKLGTLFSFTMRGRKLKVLHSFESPDGADPQGKVTFGQRGQLVGTTFYDGANNAGTIYEYDLTSSTFKVLQELSAAIAGAPNAGLTYAGGKTFFGGTLSDGSGEFAAGAIIKFTE